MRGAQRRHHLLDDPRPRPNAGRPRRGTHRGYQGAAGHTACRGRHAPKVLRRTGEWPLDRFSVIDPEAWRGRTVVCIGGGPSLTAEQCEYVERARAAGRCHVIATNNAYERAPNADVLYFADQRWWTWHREKPGYTAFLGQRCSIEGTGQNIDDAEVHLLRSNGVGPGFSGNQTHLSTGMNSGYQALGLAIGANAARVVLVGYDMSYAKDGRSHWHSGHRDSQGGDPLYRTTYGDRFREVVRKKLLPEGVEVLNASLETTLTFPRVRLEAVL